MRTMLWKLMKLCFDNPQGVNTDTAAGRGGYIMYPKLSSSGAVSQQWSQCSRNQISASIDERGSCLKAGKLPCNLVHYLATL